MKTNEQQYLDNLHSLQTGATAISDPVEFMRHSRLLLRQIIPHDYYLIFIHDKMRECLSASFVYNVLPSPTEEEICISYQNPLIKDILISRQIIVRKSPDVLLPQENIAQELFAPILTPEEVIGCLYFARCNPSSFTADEVRLSEMCSFIMAAPIGRIQWEARAQQTHEILNEFREKYLSILDAIPYPAVIVNTESDQLQEVNRAFLEWVGYSRQEIFDHKTTSFFTFAEGFFPAADTWPPRPYTVQVRLANSERVETTSFSSWLTTQAPEKRFVVFLTDLTLKNHSALQSQMEQIIYTLSHDLKAPLQSLKGFATLLQEDYGMQMSGEAVSYLQRILVNVEQMEKFVADLLNYSRLHSDENVFTETESAHIIKLSLDALAGIIEQRPINIIIDANLPRITCNPTQMTQVFTNLISNALKFTHGVEIPSIEIGCGMLEGEHEFYIKDNGRGISEQDLPHIFDLFYSRDENQNNNSSGVGLAIVKRIIEQHHGRVWAESIPEGGTAIKFTLPKVLQQQLILA
ncbi:GAF domain-containing protein [candidate division KSB1 bacterium]|nr:GAF domain-containing protein [candidate division KSB1 bacterium]